MARNRAPRRPDVRAVAPTFCLCTSAVAAAVPGGGARAAATKRGTERIAVGFPVPKLNTCLGTRVAWGPLSSTQNTLSDVSQHPASTVEPTLPKQATPDAGRWVCEHNLLDTPGAFPSSLRLPPEETVTCNSAKSRADPPATCHTSPSALQVAVTHSPPPGKAMQAAGGEMHGAGGGEAEGAASHALDASIPPLLCNAVVMGLQGRDGGFPSAIGSLSNDRVVGCSVSWGSSLGGNWA